jgi:hypothetical protein
MDSLVDSIGHRLNDRRPEPMLEALSFASQAGAAAWESRMSEAPNATLSDHSLRDIRMRKSDIRQALCSGRL